MKRITNLAILALLGLSSCTQEFTYDPTQEIQENAENILGLIDPNQDWLTTTSGTVTITADAPPIGYYQGADTYRIAVLQ